MEIRVYPSFNEVFVTDELMGIFYPLCSVDNNLHFVSSNGLWMDEKYKTENNTSEYTIFEIKNRKYDFKGDIRLYKGYKFAKIIFSILENDFVENGNNYLQTKLNTNSYIDQIIKLLPSQTAEDIDLEYYLQTFYEFNINKLNYNLNGKFGEFNYLMKGYSKPEKSNIVYGVDDTGDLLVEETIIKDYSAIGMVIGCEFFTDGNNSNLYYNERKNKVLSINTYD